jgi:hypothetical protein
VYKPNPKDFSDLDEENVQEKELNTTSLNESENEVNKKYNKSTLVGEEEVLIKSLVKFLEKINIVF